MFTAYNKRGVPGSWESREREYESRGLNSISDGFCVRLRHQVVIYLFLTLLFRGPWRAESTTWLETEVFCPLTG